MAPTTCYIKLVDEPSEAKKRVDALIDIISEDNFLENNDNTREWQMSFVVTILAELKDMLKRTDDGERLSLCMMYDEWDKVILRLNELSLKLDVSKSHIFLCLVEKSNFFRPCVFGVDD